MKENLEQIVVKKVVYIKKASQRGLYSLLKSSHLLTSTLTPNLLPARSVIISISCSCGPICMHMCLHGYFAVYHKWPLQKTCVARPTELYNARPTALLEASYSIMMHTIFQVGLIFRVTSLCCFRQGRSTTGLLSSLQAGCPDQAVTALWSSLCFVMHWMYSMNDTSPGGDWRDLNTWGVKKKWL